MRIVREFKCEMTGDVCLILVNLSSSAAAINSPFLNIHAEVSECRKFKPKT